MSLGFFYVAFRRLCSPFRCCRAPVNSVVERLTIFGVHAPPTLSPANSDNVEIRILCHPYQTTDSKMPAPNTFTRCERACTLGARARFSFEWKFVGSHTSAKRCSSRRLLPQKLEYRFGEIEADSRHTMRALRSIVRSCLSSTRTICE